jgi:hypothetical protein
MEQTRRQGRPRARARAARCAHAQRLLLTLISITERLRRLQTDPEARAVYREIEGDLAMMLRKRITKVPVKRVRSSR